jgi:hypothetical protein
VTRRKSDPAREEVERMSAEERWVLCDELHRVLLGLEDLDPRLPRAWRVVLQPTFHPDVAITVVDLDGGGLLEVRVIAGARGYAMAEAGFCQANHPDAPLPEPLVYSAPLSAADLARVAAAIPQPRLPPADDAARDGISLRFEVLAGGEVHFSKATSPTKKDRPLHHAFAQVLCTLALDKIIETAVQAAVRAAVGYLR